MILYPGVDASNPGHAPGNPLPAGTKILAGYVGALELAGQPDTPHIWTPDDWNQYLDPDSMLYGGPDLRTLPIYTRDFTGNPTLDATNAIDGMIDLGWHPNWQRICAWDSEFLINQAYEDEFAATLWDVAGWGELPYGVARTITQVPVPAHSPGVWGALLQSAPPKFLPPGWAGQQWRFGQLWDFDVFSQAVYDQCGRGPRVIRP